MKKLIRNKNGINYVFSHNLKKWVKISSNLDNMHTRQSNILTSSEIKDSRRSYRELKGCEINLFNAIIVFEGCSK